VLPFFFASCFRIAAHAETNTAVTSISVFISSRRGCPITCSYYYATGQYYWNESGSARILGHHRAALVRLAILRSASTSQAWILSLALALYPTCDSTVPLRIQSESLLLLRGSWRRKLQLHSIRSLRTIIWHTWSLFCAIDCSL